MDVPAAVTPGICAICVDHALLRRNNLVAAQVRHIQIGCCQRHSLWLDPQRRMQRALHPSHRHQRCRHQQRAQRNLHAQQNIAQSETPKGGDCGRPAFHHLRRIGAPNLPCRQQTKQNSAAE